MHFYMRNAKLDEIKSFQKSNKLSSLGMPNFIGNGSHDLDGVKHRFVVMPRYGKDIWSIFLNNGRKFPQHTVSRLGIQMVRKNLKNFPNSGLLFVFYFSWMF